MIYKVTVPVMQILIQELASVSSRQSLRAKHKLDASISVYIR